MNRVAILATTAGVTIGGAFVAGYVSSGNKTRSGLRDDRPAAAAPVANTTPQGTPAAQQLTTQQKRLEATLAWNHRTLAPFYDTVGKKDPRWDDVAHRALEKAAQYFSRYPEPRIDVNLLHKETRDAIVAGCDDPLIQYFHSRSCDLDDPALLKEARRFADLAAAGMKNSAYPPFRRMCAVLHAAGMQSFIAKTPEERGVVLGKVDEALALLPISAAEDERCPMLDNVWFETAENLVADYRRLGFDPEQALARVEKGLSATPALAVTASLVRGNFYHDWAGDARGTGVASTVSPEAYSKYFQRQALARKAFESAWAADPGNRHAATGMLGLQLENDDRATMETWFARAMEADGDNRDACWIKMEWLHPKWHGTAEEMMAFGRACRDTNNVRSGIPLLLAEAHEHMADMAGDRDAQRAYLHRGDVWHDINEVYRPHLEYHPNDLYARTYFAYLALVCWRLSVAGHEFDLLGDRLQASHRYTVEVIRKMRDDAFKRGGGRPANGNPAPKEWLVSAVFRRMASVEA